MSTTSTRRPRKPLPTHRQFVLHLARNVTIAVVFVAASLTLGAVGYHALAGLGWLDAYLNAALIESDRKCPLFRSLDRHRVLSLRRMHRLDVLAMIKRRALAAGISTAIGCHTFRATGITTYLKNGGTLEHAQHIANHESPRTTGLYDRR